MDDPDLQLLRAFRADEAEPPADLQARIEERLWQSILAEESARASGSRHARPRWFERLFRPLVAAGAAATLAIGVAVASDGGAGTSTLGQANVTQAGAGILDSTANSLFGGSTAAASPIAGRIDLTDGAERERLVEGPQQGQSGESLDDEHADLARGLTRDPAQLLQALRASVAHSGINDPSDVVAFHVAMRWVTNPAVPVDLRAAMLRSVQGLKGIDAALIGTDSLGRQGIVIGQLDGPSGMRSQYVLNPANGTTLEARAFMTAYLNPACPPGTVTSHAVFDEAGQPVDPATAQWVDWPQVVEACAPTVLVTP